MLGLLSGPLRSLAQTPAYHVPLGSAAAYGLLSKGSIAANDTIPHAPPVAIPIQVLGKTGTLQDVGALVKATAGVFAQGSGDVALALNDLQTAQNYCNSLASSALPSQLAGQQLMGGVYTIGGNATLVAGSPLTISGDTSTVVIINIAGNLVVPAGSQVVLSGVLPRHVYWNVGGSLRVGNQVSFRGVALLVCAALEDGVQTGYYALLSQKDIRLTHIRVMIGHNKFLAPMSTQSYCGPSQCPSAIVGSEMVNDGSFEMARCYPLTLGGLDDTGNNRASLCRPKLLLWQ